MAPSVTVGMACYQEFDSVWATLIGLRAMHGHDFDIVVVDNAPRSDARLRHVTRAVGGRYYHRPDLNGTSRPRDAVFRFSRTDWVVCVDSHVFIEQGGLEALRQYAAARPDSKDIVSGPIMGDDFRWRPTHWVPPADLPEALWGTWTTDPAYRAKWSEGLVPVYEENGEPVVGPDGNPLKRFDTTIALAATRDFPPFEIPMMGLGLFAMRRAAWPGFHSLFRGFGGEEGYIHEKVRQLGGKAICLPQLGWNHKFRDTAGPDSTPHPYPAPANDHIRNLLIGHRELGIAGYESLIRDKFGKKLDANLFAAIHAEISQQVLAGSIEHIAPQRILAVWYSNNSAPDQLLTASLQSIQIAQDQSRHAVTVVTVPWRPVPNNPFPESLAAYRAGPGHLNIVKQIRQGIAASSLKDAPDVVCFLEHDVLYAPGYFDRVGDAFAKNPVAPVVSHLDYIGLNATGWLAVRERHEPLHQLSMRYSVALANLARAEAEALATGQCLLEPDSEPVAVAPPPAITSEDPASHWGFLAVAGRAVLDLGCGIHAGKYKPDALTTPEFFLARGAAKVVGLDPDLREIPEHPRQLLLRGMIETAEDVAKLLREHKPDVLKMDAEGAERVLADVSPADAACLQEVAVEYHDALVPGCLAAVMRAVTAWGMTPQFVSLMGIRAAEYGVIYATRIRPARASWIRIPVDGFAPSVHVNHSHGRLTSHGEVVFEPVSTMGSNKRPLLAHPYWGEAAAVWPGPLESAMATAVQPAAKKCGACDKAASSTILVPQGGAGPGLPAGLYPLPAAATVEELLSPGNLRGDFRDHVPTLRELADRCPVVAEISIWDDKPTTHALVASTAKTIYSFASSEKRTWAFVRGLAGDRLITAVAIPEKLPEPVDLLIIDTSHTAQVVDLLAARYAPQVRRYLVIHCTVTFGEIGDDKSSPGVMPGVRKFLKEHPEWTAIRHDKTAHGLIVLSRDDRDKKQPPGLLRQGMNYARAVTKHVAGGRKILTAEAFNERMEICVTCEYRYADACGACGCPLEAKLSWASEECGRAKIGLPVLWGPIDDPAKIEA